MIEIWYSILDVEVVEGGSLLSQVHTSTLLAMSTVFNVPIIDL